MKKTLLLAAACAATLALQAQNPYLPLWEHVPDGEPRVFEDPDLPGHYRAYIIGSHDVSYTQYCGPDIRMWSAPVEDLTQWRDEGAIFSYHIDGQWDIMYAPDLVEVKDPATGRKTYYLYPHSRGDRRIGMVCKGDRPDGPFTPLNLTPDGRACVDGSMIGFDPSVCIEAVTDKKDPDYATGFRAYVYYGFQHSTAVELDPTTMYSPRPGSQMHDPAIPACSRDGKLLDPEGTVYTTLYKDQDPHDFNFFEASSIRQVGNKYVMVFSGYSGTEYGMDATNSALRYAYGDTPLGPWRSGGVLVDSRGVMPNEDGSRLVMTNSAHNTHGSLQQINGQWYVFYHRPPRGFGYSRQAMVAPVKIEWDKKSVAKGGTVRITAYDPYSPNNEWTAQASNGTQYTGAEVTSEGFQLFGLPPYGYYTAGIASYMSNCNWLQDSWDNWQNHMDLCGITNRGIVGFKYFGFGGLAQDTKGVKAFEGARTGNGTKLHVWLTPRAGKAFKLHVLLNGPYVNAVHGGREIGVIEVPAGLPATPQEFTLDVASAVEGLQGKHALYLVADGPEVQAPVLPEWARPKGPQPPYGLFDLQGIGFSKKDMSLQRPVAPKVTITVDGEPAIIPDTPIRFTNANGYTESNRYQVYAPMTDASVIQVTADQPGVETEIGRIADGRATVTCTYRGQKKIYLIN